MVGPRFRACRVRSNKNGGVNIGGANGNIEAKVFGYITGVKEVV